MLISMFARRMEETEKGVTQIDTITLLPFEPFFFRSRYKYVCIYLCHTVRDI